MSPEESVYIPVSPRDREYLFRIAFDTKGLVRHRRSRKFYHVTNRYGDIKSVTTGKVNWGHWFNFDSRIYFLRPENPVGEIEWV